MVENHWSTWLTRGIEAAERGDRDTARTLLRNVVAEHPETEVAWLWLAQLADSALEKAEYIKQVLALNADFKPLREALREELVREGSRRAEAGDATGAHACFSEAIALDPTDGDVWLKLAAVATTPAEAQQCLENVITLNPSNFEAALWLKRVRPPTLEMAVPAEIFEMPDASDEPHFIIERPSGPLRTALPATPPRGTVLLVEDDAEFRDRLAIGLAEAGFRVVMAEDGMRAMRLLESVTPSVVVIDCALPILDGFEVCRLIRKQAALRSLPVVMLSETDGFRDRMKAKMAGVTDILTKAAAPLWVSEIVAKHCRQPASSNSSESLGNSFSLA